MGRTRHLVCALCWVAGPVLAVVVPLAVGASAAARGAMPNWQKRAGGAMEFDVASVRLNKGDNPQSYTNFPLGPGDVYEPVGGLFRATDRPLIVYIGFAYKVPGSQAQTLERQLPGWAISDRFDIEAHVDSSPTKDQMRLMMQALLKDRFKLAIHYENHDVPVLALEVAKLGKLGPELQPHPAESTCANQSPVDQAGHISAPDGGPESDSGDFPAVCGGIVGMPPKIQGCMAMGASNISMKLFADSIAELGQLGRPVEDRTGLTGMYDFRLDWMPQSTGPAPPGASPPLDNSAPSFIEALTEQMGLKLKSEKGLVEEIIVDQIDHPTAN